MRGTLSRLLPFVFLAALIAFIPWPASRGNIIHGVPFPGDPPPRAEDGIFQPANLEAGIASERQGRDRLIGQAWGDYDQDGWIDLFLTDPRGPNLLYRNLGDGTFQLADPGVMDPRLGDLSSGAVFADYDNDGFPDLYILNRNQPNILLRNEGGARFVDVTAEAGVGDPYDGKTASWGDYDSDGDLDLFVANWSCYPDCGRPSDGDPDALYRNNSDGTFTNVTQLLSSKVMGAGFVASFVDYDNDGDPDLYLVNDVFINERGNALWRNDGPGCAEWCFTEVSAEAGADARLMGMGLATTDFDNDGDFDFYFSNAGPMMLLENLGNGTFADVAAEAGVDLGNKGIAWGSVALDYDNDGYQDLYLALTDMLPDGVPANPLFHNLGDGTFENLSGESGIGHTGRTLGVAAADYDRDGWVDLVIGDYERGYSLFRNVYGARTDHRAIAVRLVGGGAVNRDAIGARVTVIMTDGNAQMQEVQAGSSLGAGNSLVLHFGLGNENVRSLIVRWPDGVEDAFIGLSSNREYTIHYGETSDSAPSLPAWAPALFLLLASVPLTIFAYKRESSSR